MTVGVRAFVRDADGRVLLVRHRYVAGWHLPGGGVERGEAGEEAVCRELGEEAGVVPLDRPRLASVHANGSNHILLYEVTSFDLRTAAYHAGSDEVAEAGWFAPHQLPSGTTVATARRIEERTEDRPASLRWAG